MFISLNLGLCRAAIFPTDNQNNGAKQKCAKGPEFPFQAFCRAGNVTKLYIVTAIEPCCLPHS